MSKGGASDTALLQCKQSGARFLQGGSGQDLLERLDHDVGVDAGCDVRVGFGPGFRCAQGFELGDNQAAAETGSARIVALDRRVWASQYQAAGILERVQAFKVCRAYTQALFQRVFDVSAMIA